MEEGCEIEEEIYYYDEDYSDQQVEYSTSSGKVSWILNKGWGFGKTLLMTGAVISSAPFILPPLVVTSALAFACWVPSGVVMASYTCSEKIMSKLLPYDRYEDEDAEEGVKVPDADDGVKMEGSMTYAYNDDVLLDEPAISDGVDLKLFDVYDDGEELSVSPIEVTSVRLVGSDEAQDIVSDLLEEEEMVEETRGLLEKTRDEGGADHGMEMENLYSDGAAGPRWDSVDILLDDNVVSDAVDVYVSDVIEAEDEIMFEEPEEKEIVNGFIEGGEIVNADARKTADDSDRKVLDENYNASGNAHGEDSELSEISIPRRVSGSTNAKISPQKDNIRSNKVLENEDKVWKQIEAVRSIIGYKVTTHKSYMEELNALYIFTGVEPPTPFSNHSDLAEIENRLRFLMSIIGVKDSP